MRIKELNEAIGKIEAEGETPENIEELMTLRNERAFLIQWDADHPHLVFRNPAGEIVLHFFEDAQQMQFFEQAYRQLEALGRARAILDAPVAVKKKKGQRKDA